MPIEVGVDRAGHLEKDRDREPPRTREERREEGDGHKKGAKATRAMNEVVRDKLTDGVLGLERRRAGGVARRGASRRATAARRAGGGDGGAMLRRREVSVDGFGFGFRRLDARGGCK